jgi:NH3-dependent NAD+ synthetase
MYLYYFLFMSIKNETDIAIIGLSGGADSTLVACLCVKEIGWENVYAIHCHVQQSVCEGGGGSMGHRGILGT